MYASTEAHADTQYYLDLEDKFSAHNYHPLPVVLSKGKGVFFWKWKNRRVSISSWLLSNKPGVIASRG